MVRPRLVEEGVPIGSTHRENSDEDEGPAASHHAMLMEETAAPTTRRPYHISLSSTIAASAPNGGVGAARQPKSSLQRAASDGGRAYYSASVSGKRPTAHRTNVVIGNGSYLSGPKEKNTINDVNEEFPDGEDHMEIHDEHSEPHFFLPSGGGGYGLHHHDSFGHQISYYSAEPLLQHHPAVFHPAPQQCGIQSAVQQHAQIVTVDYLPPQSTLADNSQPVAIAPLKTRTQIEIGADYRETEKMEGVEDHSIKPPLIVVDGANVAFAYGQAVASQITNNTRSNRPIPDVRGLRVVDQFFGRLCQVRFVLTQSWLRHRNHQNPEQSTVLEQLQAAGKLVTAPVSDDDDAYVLQIAQRENSQRRRSPLNHGWSYVLSNDHFRDAQQRQPELTHWLTEGQCSATGPGRISYAFGDLGRLDDHGDPEMDILPNPRHPLVVWIEQQELAQHHG